MNKEEQIKYQNSFNKEKYDRIGLMLPVGWKDKLKTEATKRSASVNALIKSAIESYLKEE